VHGCLLRLERPGESRSYLVDARFAKRTDAKAAVCLEAISQGVGDYIRAIKDSVDTKVTPAMRQWVNELVFPILSFEWQKYRPNEQLLFEFTSEQDGE
jgi:hypothetical protein